MRLDRRSFLATVFLLGGTAASRVNGAGRSLSPTRFTLSTHGCGRATGYAQTNKIVTLDGRTHAAWLDSENGKFFARVRSLDRKTGIWSSVGTIGEAHDNHGGPALATDSRGHLHVVYGPHHHPFRYRRSLRPNDSSEWTAETSFGTRCTYSSLVVLPDDTLVLVCRERTERRWVMNLYTKRVDRQWEGPRTVVHGNAPSGYTRWQTALALGNGGNTMHMSFMVYEGSELFGQVGPGYAIGYLRSRDGGRNWEHSDGMAVRLPATPATIEIVEGAPEQGGPANLRPGSIAVDSHDTPWLIYSRLDRQPFETWIAHLQVDGSWGKTPLLPTIRRQWPDRSVKTPGQIAFDEDGRMYLPDTTVRADASVSQGYWGHQTAEVALLVSGDGGRTLRALPISSGDG